MTLLDTEPLTVLEREGPDADVLKARMARTPLDDLGTTIISYEEQTRAAGSPMSRACKPKRRVFAPTLFSAVTLISTAVWR